MPFDISSLKLVSKRDPYKPCFKSLPCLFPFLGIVLVTDAIAAMGLPPGRHHLGTMEINIEKNRATLVGTNTLAGRFAFCSCNYFICR